jgi:hypothetical protein
MLLFAAIISVPVLGLLVVGFADRHWPARFNRRGSQLAGGTRRLGVLAVVALTVACRGGAGNFLTDAVEARHLVPELRVELTKAADASNRAVMADTDEASIAFAHDAEQLARSIENDALALGVVLDRLGYTKEAQALAEFQRQFVEYRKLDGTILALAVQNTNLKAQRLSFGPAREAAGAFRRSLEAASAAFAEKDRCRAEGLVAKAVLAVAEVEVIQGPHIAERDDAAMAGMEKEMASLQATARGALRDVTVLAPAPARADLTAASAALDRFDTLVAQIVALSRQNTNVRSLDLALRGKPPLTAACDESLRVIAESLAQRADRPSR